MSHLSGNIRFLRKRKKLSQEMLANELGMNRGNIASYEKESAEPSIKNLLKISKYFNVTLSDLVEKDLEELAGIIGISNSMNGQSMNFTGMPEKQLVDELLDSKQRLEVFRMKSDGMAKILDGFRQFHKFKMESMREISDDVRKMALDYEKLLEVLEEVLKTNKNLLALLEFPGAAEEMKEEIPQ